LTAAVVTRPAHGSLTFNSDGSFSYQPSPDFLGDDKFTYRISDSSATPGTTADNTSPVATDDVATVRIYVLPTDPLAPFRLGTNLQSTDENGPQKITGYASIVSASGDGQ